MRGFFGVSAFGGIQILKNRRRLAIPGTVPVEIADVVVGKNGSGRENRKYEDRAKSEN